MGETCYSCFTEKSTTGACPHCGYDPASDEGKYPIALRAGSILNGRYIVGRVLGQGGFGITYLAQDYRTKGLVAVKEYLPTEFAGRTTGTYAVQVYSGDRRENFEYGKEQFLAEAKTLAEFIGNEHIVRIHSYFEEYGTAYLAMEYIDGESLDKYMRNHGGRLSVERANELLLPVMEALDWVHSKGIVHRDIAPDNIIITKDGTAKLIDFGAARYSTGEKSKSLDIILKHGFAPKEQYIRRGRQGPFTDVYAMAATYYYAITGKIPPDSIERMDEDELIPPTTLGVKMTGSAEEALLKGLEVSAAQRYQRMGELAEGLGAKAIRQSPEQPAARSFDFSRPEAAKANAANQGSRVAEPIRPEYTEAEQLLANGNKAGAAIAFGKIADYRDARERSLALWDEVAVRSSISAGHYYTAGLKADGTVIAKSRVGGSLLIKLPWRNIVAVSVGLDHIVGLKSDGTVVAVGGNYGGQCDFSDWSDVVAVSAGGHHTVGLKADGTVATAGNNVYGQRNNSGWTDIIAVSAGRRHTVGLKSDGTVVAVGANEKGQCDVSGWSDIIAVSAGEFHTLGLKADGSVVATGYNADGRCNISGWADIVAVSAGLNHSVGLKADGTVVAKGLNNCRQCNVSDWTDIVAISAGDHCTLGLRADSTVLASSNSKQIQRNTSGFMGIRLPYKAKD